MVVIYWSMATALELKHFARPGRCCSRVVPGMLWMHVCVRESWILLCRSKATVDIHPISSSCRIPSMSSTTAEWESFSMYLTHTTCECSSNVGLVHLSHYPARSHCFWPVPWLQIISSKLQPQRLILNGFGYTSATGLKSSH